MATPYVANIFGWAGRTGTLPASIVAGDVLILNVTKNSGHLDTLSITGPSGAAPWTTLSPLLLGRPSGFGSSTSYPGVVAYRKADGSEAGMSVTVNVNGTATDIALAGLVVSDTDGADPVLNADTGPYPWYKATTGTLGHSLVPAIPAAANTLQLICANGQQQGGVSPIYTYTGGFTRQVEVNRWFPSIGWAAQGFPAASAGSACTVVQTSTASPDPDPYCYLITFVGAAPADEPGYCLSTLHTYGTDQTSEADLALQLSGDVWFVPKSYGVDHNSALYALTPSSGALTLLYDAFQLIQAVASTSDGTTFLGYLNSNVIARVAPDGTVTDPWVSLPANYSFGSARENPLGVGRDGALYASVRDDDNIHSAVGYTVFQIDIAGATFTHLTALDAPEATNAEYAQPTASSDGVVWVVLATPPSPGPDFGVNTALRRYDPSGPTVTDIAIQSLVSPSTDGTTEAYGGLFCDADDHLWVGMTTVQATTPTLSWFLRVDPSGTATRIAGTWDYGASPPPAATATNIADGPLNTSLACSIDGAGMSIDGKTLYFFDDGDQNGGTFGNLLRKLALCAVAGNWTVGAVRFRT